MSVRHSPSITPCAKPIQRIAQTTLFLSSGLLLALTSACSDAPHETGPSYPQYEIRDGAHSGGNPHFYFLPPLVDMPHFSGTFDGSLAPIVRISRGSLLIAELPADPHSEGEMYSAIWMTPDQETVPDAPYRLSVIVGSHVLGYADVVLAANGKELRNLQSGDVVGLVAGRALPIKFRIEDGALPSLPILFLHEISDSNEDIYSVLMDGTGLTRITDSPGRDYAPRWSPDRTRVAFSSERWCGGCGIAPELYVAAPDGSGAVQLTSGLYAVYGVTWSPDGSRLAVESQGGTYLPSNLRIYVMNADGTGVMELTTPRSFKPDWSPDGTQILFQTFTPAGISVMDTDGSNQVQLRLTGGDNLGASWSPDGSQIVFGDWNGAESDIWIMNADGTSANRLSSGPADDLAPAWSPDGRYIAFEGPPVLPSRT